MRRGCGGGEGGMDMMRDVIERALFHPGSTIEVPERLKSVPKRNTYDLQVGERYLIDGRRLEYLGMDGKYHMFESCAGSKESFTPYQLETAEVQER